MGWEPLQISCSSGEATGFGICLEESSTLPTRSASGSLVALGVDGGGQFAMVGGFGVLFALAAGSMTLEALGVSFDIDVLLAVMGTFSLSCSRVFVASTMGAPSMNLKALSLVRVWVDGMMGGPVTTCRRGGAEVLLAWGYGGPLRWRCHWPFCYQTKE